MRDNRIDILRFLGLAMIILAHIGPPDILFQLRNFDVPLMLMVSGMSFGLSYTGKVSYLTYIWKRVKRLLFPVWLFLTIYFIVLFLFAPDSSEIQANTIFRYYKLDNGIGYVWIFRVFLLVALVSPLIYLYHKKIDSHFRYLLMLALFFALYELLRYVSLPYIQWGTGRNVSLITHYLIPYSILFALGLRIPLLTKRQVLYISIINLALLILIGLGLFLAYGEFIPTIKFKYPPSIYYFSYAVFVSCLLWVYSLPIEKILEKIKLTRLIFFISHNTIWIYLWHIPFIKILQMNFALKYIVIFSISVTIVYCQVWFVNNVLLGRISNATTRKNIKVLLTG